MKPLIVSFFTQDWEYPDHAMRLQQECKILGLDCYISELVSTGSYRANCGKKPFFIRDSLEKFQRPILWLDVDASILKYPDVLCEEASLVYDIAAVRKKPKLDHWYVGSIWFNFTPNTMTLLDKWCQSLGSAADDGAFQSVYASNKHTVKILELDPAIHTIMMRHGGHDISDATCFAHRISRGESKNLEKQMSKKISRAKKQHAKV